MDKPKVIKTEQVTSDIFLIRMESEEIADSAAAGQFVNIKCCNGFEAYLRRPISICSIDRQNKTFDIVYQVKGKGTKALCCFKPGDEIDLMGPLGRGFSINPDHRHIVVVGGGIGVFPLLQLLRDHPAQEKTAILGYRCRDAVVLEDEFRKYCNKLLIATDDGSYGEKGFATSVLHDELQKKQPDMVYFCGPAIMMKNGVDMLRAHHIPCEVSMEQRMGCGIGACLVCACKTRRGNDWDYAHVCKDGPVFNGYDVIFD